MSIALWVADKVQKLVEIRVIKLHRCKLQYNQINQMCDHNQDSIEICSAQQAELIQWFKIIFNEDISQEQIFQFLSNIYSYLDNNNLSHSHASKQHCIQRWLKLESVLFQWHKQMKEKIIITEDLLKTTANRFFQQISAYYEQELSKWSNSWLDNFKKRYWIKKYSLHEESDEMNQAAAAKKLINLFSIIVKQICTYIASFIDIYLQSSWSLFLKRYF